MLYEAEGKLYEIFETQQIKETFKKREFVLEVQDNKYTQYIKFQLIQDKCELLDSFEKGQDVKVSFALQGKPFTNKEGKTIYFTNLNAVRITGNQSQDEAEFNQANESHDPNQDAPPPDADDMPF